MRTFSMYFALFRCMRIDQDRVGETTSMYANRPRPCMRNDLDVCESTCMRNDRHPYVILYDMKVTCNLQQSIKKRSKWRIQSYFGKNMFSSFFAVILYSLVAHIAAL